MPPNKTLGKILAYLRASTDKQETNIQKLEILEFARKKEIKIDDYIELTISSRKSQKQRRIKELISRQNPSDTLIVTEPSQLGRSTAEVIALINALVETWLTVFKFSFSLDLMLFYATCFGGRIPTKSWIFSSEKLYYPID